MSVHASKLGTKAPDSGWRRGLVSRLRPVIFGGLLVACGSSTGPSGGAASLREDPAPAEAPPPELSGAGESEATTGAAPETTPPRPARVFYSLAEHLERAERWIGEERFIDFGADADDLYTLGGWTSGVAAAPARATREDFAIIPGGRAKLALPIAHAGGKTVELRLRAFRGDRVSAYVDGDAVELEIVSDAGEALPRVPRDGFARVRIQAGTLAAGEHTLMLRTRGGSGSFDGRIATLGLDWMRIGDASAPLPAAASLGFRVGPEAALRVPPGQGLSFTTPLPEGARLRGVARGAGVVRVEAEGGAVAARHQVVAGAFDVDLADHAGKVVRLRVDAPDDAPLELVRPSLVTLDPAGAPPASEARRPRNVLLYLVDTLRADHLSPYNGETRVQTPGLGAFLERAVTMERAHSQENWTKPSVATLLSSLMPWEHTAVQDRSVVPASVQLLPEILREQGFFTGSFIANGYVSDRFGFQQGWHTYRNYIREGRRTQAEFVAADVLRWLDEREDTRPFLLYVHTIDPHVPYRRRDDTFSLYGNPTYRGPATARNNADLLGQIKLGRVELDQAGRDHLEALYDGEITYHDVHFRAILDGLERRHLADDTLVIVTSDHGEEFWDHGSVGHGHSVYEELLHVPMFVRHPGLPHARRGVRSLPTDVGLVDVMPTILDALGLEIPEEVSGRSFLPALLGEPESAPRATVSGFMENWRAVSVGRWKLIHRANGQISLYDLASDPDETDNIADANPLTVRWLRGLLGLTLARTATESGEARARRPRRRHQSESTEIDDETRAQLRALGYMVD